MESSINFTGGTFRDSINELVAQYGGRIAEELFNEHGELGDFYMLLVNNERQHSLSAKIDDGDGVIIITILGEG
jgi:molybdopterin converting factor small subunit